MYGFETAVVEPVTALDMQISSTRIREEIKNGNLQAANQMLGHPYILTGEVTHGREIGRTIDFPTVNLIPAPEKILPPNGVYLSYCSFGKERKKSVTNIGRKPTVGGQTISAETHILDYSGDLYGQKIRVEVLEYLRPEKKFSSLDELKKQITQDIEKARKCF
jgi:riboflavin kinase/FMN adenylyltransferase